MTATPIDGLIRAELAELVVQASRCMETDQELARRCIRRAAELVRSFSGAPIIDLPALATVS